MRRILQVNDRRRALRLSKAELRRQAKLNRNKRLRALDAFAMFANMGGVE